MERPAKIFQWLAAKSLSKDSAQITESFVWKEIETPENIDQSFKLKTKEVV